MILSFWQALATSIVCGGIVGFERQVSGKPTGVRTSVLICLGSQLFVQLGGSIHGGNLDPTRVVGQVVTGIGFLGAGVILSEGGHVLGVTSASAIWVTAAIGACVGLGHYAAALILAVVTVVVLNVFDRIGGRLSGISNGHS